MKVLKFMKYAASFAISALILGCAEDTTEVPGPTPVPPPKVISISPTTGKAGISVIASGENLSPFDSIRLGKIRLSVNTTSATAFSFTVPVKAITSKLYVYKGKAVDSSQTFTVIPTTDELDVEDLQNILVSEFTATWCGPCGQWGKPLITEVAERYGNRSVKVSFNSSITSDILYVPDASVFSDYANVNQYPTQAINLQKVNIDFLLSLAQVKQQIYDISDPAAAKAPEAVVGLSFTETTPGNYSIRTRTRFITDMPSGKYNVGVFIIQDNIIEAQNGNSENYEHKGVFRKIATIEQGTKENWGSEIATEPKAGDKFEKNFTVQAPNITGKLAWVKQNMKAVAVIYKMDETTNKPISVVNCNMVKAKM